MLFVTVFNQLAPKQYVTESDVYYTLQNCQTKRRDKYPPNDTILLLLFLFNFTSLSTKCIVQVNIKIKHTTLSMFTAAWNDTKSKYTPTHTHSCKSARAHTSIAVKLTNGHASINKKCTL